MRDGTTASNEPSGRAQATPSECCRCTSVGSPPVQWHPLAIQNMTRSRTVWDHIYMSEIENTTMRVINLQNEHHFFMFINGAAMMSTIAPDHMLLTGVACTAPGHHREHAPWTDQGSWLANQPAACTSCGKRSHVTTEVGCKEHLLHASHQMTVWPLALIGLLPAVGHWELA